MKILVYEYCCGQGARLLSEQESLLQEGMAMLTAVLADFRGCPGVETHVLAAPAIGESVIRGDAGVLLHLLEGNERESLERLAREMTWVMVIAPEQEHQLLDRCKWVREAGNNLLGSTQQAIRLTADKLALATHLVSKGVPAILPGRRFPAVLKPRFGAGSQATFLVEEESLLASREAQARIEGGGEMILQPYHPGQPVSVSFLKGSQIQLPLPACEQILSADGRFHYLGGRTPLRGDLGKRAEDLAARAVSTVPGLLGAVGVDLVLGEPDDGCDDVVVEINPRLTTSYVGLRARAGRNLMEVLLSVIRGELPGDIPWKKGGVRFHPSGEVEAIQTE